jgi:hypothetical protein
LFVTAIIDHLGSCLRRSGGGRRGKGDGGVQRENRRTSIACGGETQGEQEGGKAQSARKHWEHGARKEEAARKAQGFSRREN